MCELVVVQHPEVWIHYQSTQFGSRRKTLRNDATAERDVLGHSRCVPDHIAAPFFLCLRGRRPRRREGGDVGPERLAPLGKRRDGGAPLIQRPAGEGGILQQGPELLHLGAGQPGGVEGADLVDEGAVEELPHLCPPHIRDAQQHRDGVEHAAHHGRRLAEGPQLGEVAKVDGDGRGGHHALHAGRVRRPHGLLQDTRRGRLLLGAQRALPADLLRGAGVGGRRVPRQAAHARLQGLHLQAPLPRRVAEVAPAGQALEQA
mmetsp:Transcript_35195/g.98867  ORF Transcript_35195/g.98867 Transcript_35195/m.98867 type:complete len:260 (+) Transcript_35195:472-1251(+)